jgi:hypothetical protein
MWPQAPSLDARCNLQDFSQGRNLAIVLTAQPYGAEYG